MRTRFILWELRHQRADRAFWLLGLLLIVLAGFALANGARQLRTQRAAIAEAVAFTESRTQAGARLAADLNAGKAEVAPGRDPRTAQGFAHYHLISHPTKPALALSTLTVGQSDLYPSVLQLALSSRDFSLRAPSYEKPQRRRLLRGDAVVVVIYLIPLLLIALSYNLLSGERERGTLPLVLLQRFSPARLVLGRSAVVGGLILGLLAALLVFGLLAARALEISELGRLALWLGVAFAYGAFWLALALLVTSRGGSSATNAIVLAGAWLLFTVVAPAAVNVAAKTICPVPSRMDHVLAERAATDEISARRSELLAVYLEDHPELVPDAAKKNAPDPLVVTQMVYATTEQRLAPVRARFAERLTQQQALVDRLKYLSPALLVQSALNDLSGTGLARHEAFRAQVSAHHDELRAYFQPRIVAKEKFDNYGEVPRFAFAEEPIRNVLARAAWPLAALLLIVAAVVATGVRSLRRYVPTAT